MRTAFAVGDFIRRCGDNFPKGEGREHSPPSLPLWGRWLSEAKPDEVARAYSAFTSAFTSANWLSTSDSFTTDDGE